MKHDTFRLLRQAYLGHVDKKALSHSPESDPFVQHTIRFTTDQGTRDAYHLPWDVQPFTTQFRSVSARERLDQTVVTFLLRVVSIVKMEMYNRAFTKPQSWSATLAWVGLLKECIYTVLTLAYDLRWTTEKLFRLDAAVLDCIHDGQPSTLRDLMQQSLGIRLSQEAPYEAELYFEKLCYLGANQFGPFFWRLLHWMAEAVQMRRDDVLTRPENPDVAFAKDSWRRLVSGPLYRLLRCGICMAHLQAMVLKLETPLMDTDTDYPRLWYNIHNQVTAQKFQSGPPYSEEEYELDASFMRQALGPK